MDTIEQLKQLVQEQFGVESSAIDPDAPFASYNLDSLTVAELIFAVEDKFGVVVPDSAASTVSNLNGLTQLLDQLIAAKSA